MDLHRLFFLIYKMTVISKFQILNMRKHCPAFTFKYWLYAWLLTIIPNISASQGINFDQIIPPEEIRPTNFEDYLVQQAWINSQESQKHKVEKQIAEKEVDIARKDWLDQVQVGFNLNEVSLENVLESRENKADNIVIYPLYSFNANISFGSLYNNKKKRQVKEMEVELEVLEMKQQMLSIRREVLSRYQRLLLSKEILTARVLAEEDSKNSRDFAATRFKSGDIEVEEFTRTSEAYYSALEKRIDAESQIELAIIEIEELIGIDWEVAERMKARLE